MQNPWKKLPDKPPFVLDSDKENIMKFNKKAKGTEHEIMINVLPDPYLGNPKSNILLLALNPEYKKECEYHSQKNKYFIESNRRNRFHLKQTYPFYALDPKNAEEGGYCWWNRVLDHFIEEFGRKKIANNVFVVEYFPYHSKKYKKMKTILESQKYSFWLVEQAIKRKATIIIMRSKKLWLDAVPGLKDYPFHELRSPQNVIISENNCPKGFKEILKRLSKN